LSASITFAPHPGLLLIEPTVKDIRNVTPNRKLEKELIEPDDLALFDSANKLKTLEIKGE
jgi:hypothetical protein